MLGQLTAKELGSLEELLASEEACYEKFSHYADEAGESAVRKLCAQLADRSREHYAAILAQLDQSSSNQPQ